MEKKIIYYDGSCDLCKAVVGKVDTMSKKQMERPEKEMRVVDSDGTVHKNIDAILEILEDYPQWKWLTTFGRLPLIKQCLQIGYKFVAANRYFLYGPASRIFWLKIVIVGGLISGLLFSIRAWTGGRLFPYAPVLNVLPGLPPTAETALFIALLCILVAILIIPKPRKLIITSLIVSAIFAFFDQNRWQPWFYQYAFMLASLVLFTWDHRDVKKQQDVLNINRLIIVSIYFFSGLQKMNPVFISDTFPALLGSAAHALGGLSFIAPFIEMGIGIGLLFKKTRAYALTLAIMMHVFILYVLGPLGNGSNNSVLPWNVAMALCVIILFWKSENFSFKEVFLVNKFAFHKVVILLFGIMPVFSFFNVWDSYLSFSIYSGNLNDARIFISDPLKRNLPIEIQKYTNPIGLDKHELVFLHWAFDELSVPPYPETRVYKAIAKDICRYAVDDNDVELVITGKPTLFNRGRPISYDCSDL